MVNSRSEQSDSRGQFASEGCAVIGRRLDDQPVEYPKKDTAPAVIRAERVRLVVNAQPRRIIGHPDLFGVEMVWCVPDLYTSVGFAIYLERLGMPVEMHFIPTDFDQAALQDYWRDRRAIEERERDVRSGPLRRADAAKRGGENL